MATDLHNEQSASVTTLVSGIAHDAQELMKQQFELLKAEVRDDFRKVRDAGEMIGAGAGLALMGGILLSLALVYLLEFLFHPHLVISRRHAFKSKRPDRVRIDRLNFRSIRALECNFCSENACLMGIERGPSDGDGNM